MDKDVVRTLAPVIPKPAPSFTLAQIDNYLQRRYERGLREMKQAESVMQAVDAQLREAEAKG